MTFKIEDHAAPTLHVYRFFAFDHLPNNGLREQSRKFHSLATALLYDTPPGPEVTVCLRALLEAKDAGVRALLTP